MKNYIIYGIIIIIIYIIFLYRAYIIWFFKLLGITLKNENNIKKLQRKGMDKRCLKNEEIEKYINYSLKALNNIDLEIKRQFILNDDLERHLRYSRFSEKYVNELFKDILEYLKLNDKNITLKINYISSKYFIKYAGLYIEKKDNEKVKEIVLNIQNDMTMNTVISILAHECTHYLLMTNNIKLKNTIENECLTDITTIILGFGRYMVEGYKISNKVIYDEVNHRSVKKDRVGYLSYKDIEYTIKYLKKIKVG